jgi:branched-chain amino acid transport system permease protein
MTLLLQHLIDALSLGGTYALTALGIGLIFGVMRLVNFAQAEYITLGAYALIVPSAADVAKLWLGAFPPIIVVIGTVLVSTCLAVVSSIVVFRRFSNASPAIMMIGSFTLGFILQNIVLSIFGSRPKAVGIWPELGRSIKIVGIQVPRLEIITVGVTLVLLVVLSVFLYRTFLGIQIRGAAEDFMMARLLGVHANRVIALAFGVSGLLAGMVSLQLVVQTGVVSYQMGVPVVLIAFIATVVGGMGSLRGAVFGGILIGLVSVALQVLLPENLRAFREAFVFAGVILILLLRPSGIIRVKTMEQRV